MAQITDTEARVDSADTSLALRIKPELLERLRSQDGATEAEQAGRLGVDLTALQHVESGAALSAAFLARMCAVYGDLALRDVAEIVRVTRSGALASAMESV